MNLKKEADKTTSLAASALDDLLSRALAYRTGGELRSLVEFTRRFPQLAPYNAMLLHVQNRGIAYALRAGEWEAIYKRRIKPAARPYVILRTMGPVAFVFDLSDTEPIDPADDRVPEGISNPFPAKGQPPPLALERMTNAAEKIGIVIEMRDFATQLAGQVQRVSNPDPPKLTPLQQGLKDAMGDLLDEDKCSVDFHIALNSKHTEAQRLATLAHELAHIFCGHLGATENGFWPDRRNSADPTREIEAEAVAYFVTERLNLDIGSVRYLAGYVNENDPLPAYSLDCVLKAVGNIEAMVRGALKSKPRKRERARGQVEPRGFEGMARSISRR